MQSQIQLQSLERFSFLRNHRLLYPRYTLLTSYITSLARGSQFAMGNPRKSGLRVDDEAHHFDWGPPTPSYSSPLSQIRCYPPLSILTFLHRSGMWLPPPSWPVSSKDSAQWQVRRSSSSIHLLFKMQSSPPLHQAGDFIRTGNSFLSSLLMRYLHSFYSLRTLQFF